jgi:hypothetical protein
VHGITSLSTADKLSVVTTETAGRLIDDLVDTYLIGLGCHTRSTGTSNAEPPNVEPRPVLEA